MTMVSTFTTLEGMRTSFQDVPEDLRCRYASKPCGNLRTTKRGGGLHRFCDFHRTRANENQWRVDHRRRLRKRETGSPLASPRERSPRNRDTNSPTALPLLMPSDCSIGIADNNDMMLSAEDLLLLQTLLFCDDDDDALIMA